MRAAFLLRTCRKQLVSVFVVAVHIIAFVVLCRSSYGSEIQLSQGNEYEQLTIHRFKNYSHRFSASSQRKPKQKRIPLHLLMLKEYKNYKGKEPQELYKKYKWSIQMSIEEGNFIEALTSLDQFAAFLAGNPVEPIHVGLFEFVNDLNSNAGKLSYTKDFQKFLSRLIVLAKDKIPIERKELKFHLLANLNKLHCLTAIQTKQSDVAAEYYRQHTFYYGKAMTLTYERIEIGSSPLCSEAQGIGLYLPDQANLFQFYNVVIESEIADAYQSTGQKILSRKHAKYVLDLVTKLPVGYVNEKYFLKANAYTIIGKFEEAVPELCSFMRNVLDLYGVVRAEPWKSSARTYYDIVDILRPYHLLKSLEMKLTSKESQRKLYADISLKRLAQIKYTDKDFSASAIDYKNLFQLKYEEDPNSLELVPLLNALGQCAKGMNKFHEANSFFQQALAIAESHEREDFVLATLEYIVDTAQSTKDWRFAESELFSSLNRKMQRHDIQNRHIVGRYKQLYEFYMLYKREPLKAEKMLFKSIEIARKDVEKDWKLLSYTLANMALHRFRTRKPADRWLGKGDRKDPAVTAIMEEMNALEKRYKDDSQCGILHMLKLVLSQRGYLN